MRLRCLCIRLVPRGHRTALLCAALLSASACAAGDPSPDPSPGGLGSILTARAATQPSQNPPEVVILSMDQAVQRALKESPALASARAVIEQDQAEVDQARAFQYPSLTGRTQAAKQVMRILRKISAPREPGVPAHTHRILIEKSFTRSLALSAGYNVDLFGQVRDGIRIAGYSYQESQENYQVLQNQLVATVQWAYLNALRAQDLAMVARDAVESAQGQQRSAQSRVQSGAGQELDVVRASVQAANLQQFLVIAQANDRHALGNLARLLRLDPNTQLRLLPVSQAPHEEEATLPAARDALPQTLDATLAEAFHGRRELAAAESSIRKAQEQVRLGRKGYLPSLSFGGTLMYNPDRYDTEQGFWRVEANLNIPLWDGGQTRARIRGAEAQVNVARAQLQEAQDAVAEDVERALNNLQEAGERRKTAAANTAQAREALQRGQAQYAAGHATYADVSQIQLSLSQARTNEVNATYDYLVAAVELNRSLGRYVSAPRPVP
jgi:outer membrane protein